MLDLIAVPRWLPIAIMAYVILERATELPIAARNTKALVARGGVEAGAGHYPALVAMHIMWLLSVAGWVAATPPRLSIALMIVFALTQILRVWVMVTLGPYWTTRIITVPGAPLVKRGPYRFLRHPNYVVVVIEIAVLPLAFGAWHTAIAFTILNAIMLWIRIRAENWALAPRRAAPPQHQ